MEPTKIFVVGAGKLANAILHSNLSVQSCAILKWDAHNPNSHEKAIVVHAGSGRQLKECFEFCSQSKSLLIELSTGLETETMMPDFPLIICPNTSILLLKTLNAIKAHGKYFDTYTTSIIESHQATKKTEPGTAYAFAKSLNFPVDKIISIRDPEVQQNRLGIPEEYLSNHAYHKIVMKDGNDEVTIETKVLGHASYASGVKKIVEAMIKHKLDNKRYTILDLIDKNIL